MEALAAMYLMLLSGCVVMALLVSGMYEMLALRLGKAQSAKLRTPAGRKWFIPWLGETLDLLLSDVDDFLSRHTQKYGDTFSTHVFGGPAVVTTTMDASAFCLSTPQAHHALRAIYSNDILGRDSLSMIPAGARHTALRKLLQHQLLAPEAMRGFCTAVSQTALSCMKPWEEKVVMEEEATKFAFRVVLRFTCGSDYQSYSHEQVEELLHLFADMENGLMSLPVNIPFMGRRRALNARKKVDLFAHKLIEARKGRRHDASGQVDGLDGLSSLMEADVVEGYEAQARKLRSGEVLDNLLLLLGAGHRAPGIFLTWVVKLLADYPHILEQVQAEQDAIAEDMRLAGRQYVTWEDTKKMQLTWRVIQETMRITTPAAFVMRKARRDLEFQGMLIPRGWRVLVFWRSVHLNPEVHPNPKQFDPSRFEKPIAAPSFSPFGMGPRGCPGSEFAKQEMLVFLHHLVTTFTWKPVNPDEKIKQWPIACLNQGLPITLERRSLFKVAS